MSSIATEAGTARDVPPPPLRFRILTCEELLSREVGEHLIEGVLPRSGFVVFYGKPKTLKTFLVLSAGLSIAGGVSWYGRATRSGAVLYVIGEGIGRFPLRVGGWLAEQPDNVAASARARFFCLDRPVQMLHEQDVADIARAIDALPERPVLIVLDTLARCFAGGNESEAEDMTRFVAGVDELRARFGATVGIVHHSVKDGTSLRGSSVLEAAADSVFRVERAGERITLSCEHQKDSAELEPMQFVREVVDLGSDPAGRPIASCTLRQLQLAATTDSATARAIDGASRKSARHRVVAALAAAPGDQWLTVADLEHAGCGGHSNISRLLSVLVKEGVASKRGSGYRLAHDGGAS